MDKRKLQVVGPGNAIVCEDGTTFSEKDRAELVRRWNTYQYMHNALTWIAGVEANENSEPDVMADALHVAVATAQGALRKVKEGSEPSTADPFTVILAYPDYFPNEGGHPTWMGHVHAKDKSDAVLVARGQVMEELFKSHGENMIENGEDLYTIAVIAGHHEDLAVSL